MKELNIPAVWRRDAVWIASRQEVKATRHR